jgi:hypothetical protein
MDPAEWMVAFKRVHEHAKKHGSDEKHKGMKEELARSLVAAQGLTVPEGQTHRKTFRIAQAWQLELDGMYKCLTRDVSGGGFSALVPGSFTFGQEVRFSIRIGGGQEPVTGTAKVVASVKQAGNSRVSFNIVSVPTADVDRFENAIFDSVLSRYG